MSNFCMFEIKCIVSSTASGFGTTGNAFGTSTPAAGRGLFGGGASGSTAPAGGGLFGGGQSTTTGFEGFGTQPQAGGGGGFCKLIIFFTYFTSLSF